MYLDNRLLEALVVFAETGTLSATAETLLLTQPTVTRNMQRLEEDLGVSLFERSANRVTLTETGQLAAQKAKKLLKDQVRFIETLQQFDREQQSLLAATTAPGPIILLETSPTLRNLIDPSLILQEEVAEALLTRRFSFVFTTEEIFTEEIESLYIGDETLYVHIDAKLVSADKTQTSFKELANTSFVTLSNIGEWATIIERDIPKGKFLYQEKVENLHEILKNSNLAYFTSSIAEPFAQAVNRRRLAVTDESARMPFYLTYLTSQKKRLAPTFDQIKALWHTLS